MRPCSVLVDYQVRPPVKRLTAEAEDRSGNLVYTAEFSDLGSGPHPWRIHVKVPGERPGECPAPVTGELILTVQNREAEECQVLFRGRSLGAVAARSTEAFGPLAGTWEDVSEVSIRDAGGEEREARNVAHIRVEYELGGPAEVSLEVVGWP